MKVVSPTNRPPLPPGNILGTHFRYSLSRYHGHSATRRMSMKNSSGNIENRTRDLPARSAESQPTAPPHAHLLITSFQIPAEGQSYVPCSDVLYNTRCRRHDTIQACRTTAWASSGDYQRPLQAATCTTTLNLAFVLHCARCRSIL